MEEPCSEVRLRALGFRKPTPVPVRICWWASSPSTAAVLSGRKAPKEKELLRLPTAIELRMAAVAPAAETLFQSVEMVDMRWSTFSVQARRFWLVLVRLNLM